MWPFRKNAPKPALQAKKPDLPKWGEYRIVRIEHAGGRVYFIVQQFGWMGQTSGTRYHAWHNFLIERGVGPIEFVTLEAAEAALAARIASDEAKAIKSETVVWPRTTHPEQA